MRPLALIFIFVFCFFSSNDLKATHLRAGQISASRTDPIALTYRITLTLYRDKCVQCVELASTARIFIRELNVELTASLVLPLNEVGNNTQEGRYEFNYTFSGAGTFTIIYSDPYRNDVVNMSNSLGTEFYVESQIIINPFLGRNSTPILQALPIDFAGLGRKFLHNPGAYDPDGDSLSYSFVTPRQGFNINVTGYQPLSAYMTTAEGGGAPSFIINPSTGTVTWDSPNTVGNFNFAIKVQEWRKNVQGNYISLGYVVRDMQVRVSNSTNKRPILQLPPNLCVVVGDVIGENITATDPDNNQVIITTTSQLYDASFPNPKASYLPNPPVLQPTTPFPARLFFRWLPSCDHIRERPYQVLFKAEDSPTGINTPLVDIQIWEIKVLGPKILNVTATPNNLPNEDNITLNWTAYSCATRADRLIIWRKENCSPDALASCETGVPKNAGYTAIGRILPNLTTYTDRTVRAGVRYTYRISATFAPPSGGESVPSDPICAGLDIDTPLFTKVDIIETSTTTGKINVAFVQPWQFGTPNNPPTAPYGYKLFRAEGLTGGTFTEVQTYLNVAPADLTVLTFADNNLNTANNAYRYRLAFFSNATDETNKVFRDSSDVASTVKLTNNPPSGCIRVDWTYNVGWSNQLTKHDVFRSNDGAIFNVIGTPTDVILSGTNNGNYTDTGLTQAQNYTYRILTRGGYQNPNFTARYPVLEPFLNNSQTITATPKDITPPCPPALSIPIPDCTLFSVKCGTSSPIAPPFTNFLTWKNPEGDNGSANGRCGDNTAGCEFEADNIKEYRIYYKANQSLDYQLLTTISNKLILTYSHNNLLSFVGCYTVTSVDNAGNESAKSNEVCIDNCENFVLPNVFTPGAVDGKNDVFAPCEPALFIESTDFEVYNIWGRKIYNNDQDPKINWNGKTNAGTLVATGIYYYVAKVKFFSAVGTNEKTYKGWINVLK